MSALTRQRDSGCLGHVCFFPQVYILKDLAQCLDTVNAQQSI